MSLNLNPRSRPPLVRLAFILGITGGTLALLMWATGSLEIGLASGALVSTVALDFV